PGDLPRALAERAVLPRRKADVLVSRLRNPPRRSQHRLRGATLEPREDEVPAHVDGEDPDRDGATGAALGLPGGDRPSRRCAVLRPPRQDGEGPAVRSRGPDPRPPDRQAGVRERGRDDLLVRGHGGPPAVPRIAPRTREGDRRARQADGRRRTAEGIEGRGRPREVNRTPPGRRLPRESRADPTPDADLLPHP